MNKEKFKKEFVSELLFFNDVAKRDLKRGFTLEQVEDELVKCASSFYGARIDFDEYAVKKCYFIATFVYQIINGTIDEIEIDELCNEIDEEKRISGVNH